MSGHGNPGAAQDNVPEGRVRFREAGPVEAQAPVVSRELGGELWPEQIGLLLHVIDLGGCGAGNPAQSVHDPRVQLLFQCRNDVKAHSIAGEIAHVVGAVVPVVDAVVPAVRDGVVSGQPN